MPSFKHALCLVGLMLCAGAYATEPSIPPVKLDIAAQPVGDALNDFARQTGLQVYMDAQEGQGIKVQRLVGTYTPQEALKKLLENTGLGFTYVDARTVAVRMASKGKAAEKSSRVSQVADLRMAQTEDESALMRKTKPLSTGPQDVRRTNESGSSDEKGIPEVLVTGSKSLNMDIQRSEDDVQPYVIFDHDTIVQSGATDIGEFLKNRLTMNTVDATNAQTSGFGTGLGNTSTINLRAMGANQTLVLIDGRRTAAPFVTSDSRTNQTDINGIPLSAIERVEILPATASGIYGGGATGGVVNIVLKRDYAGVELKSTYDNTFDTDSAVRRVDLSAGVALENGKTNILVGASYSDSNPLLVQDRQFPALARELLARNNPNAILNSSIPILGATANIRSADGSNLVLKTGAALNAPITYSPYGYAGAASDGGSALLSNAGKYNLALPPDVSGGRGSLLSNPILKSFMVSARRRFNSRLEAFVDMATQENLGQQSFSSFSTMTDLPADASTNPFTSAIRVSYPVPELTGNFRTEVGTSRAVAGLIVKLPRSWLGELDYNYSRATYSSSYQTPASVIPGMLFSGGIIDVLRDGDSHPRDFSAYIDGPPSLVSPNQRANSEIALRFSGSVYEMRAGNLTLSALASHRRENAGDSYFSFPNNTGSLTTRLYPSRSQVVSSGYIEMLVPLVGGPVTFRGVRSASIQLSARKDAYTTRGVTNLVNVGDPIEREVNRVGSTDFTVGLKYSPAADLLLRGSYSSGFLPPVGDQLFPVFFSTSVSALDPRRGDTPASPVVPVQQQLNGDPDLQPEESRSTSFGAVLTPRLIAGLRLSVDYVAIRKTNEIRNLTAQMVLDNEAVLPGFLIRGPNLSSDRPGWAGPVTFLKLYGNIAKTKVSAVDVQLDYDLQTTRFGTFATYFSATRPLHQEQQVAPTTAVLDSIGYRGGPLDLKANAGLVWKSPRRWTVGWNGRYFSQYKQYAATQSASSVATTILNQGADHIPSQDYHDIFASYRLSRAFPMNADAAEVTLGIRNVTDRKPPILATSQATGGYSTYADPRVQSYYVSLKLSF